jgi:sulfite exporter TauE/SafE
MIDCWTAFILGLVGSLHCAGMCGPLALALPGAVVNPARFALGRVAYNAGRIATYCMLGMIFGLFGKTLLLAGIQRWVSISLGVVLIVGLFTARKLALWKPVTALVNQLKSRMSGLLRQRSLVSVGALGLLNGLLPCGLVYVAAAGATATSHMLDGVIYMAAFGAGTLPMMLAIGLGGKLVPLSFRLKLRAAIPVSVFLLGTLLILRGMSLGIPYVSPDLAARSCCR